MNKKILIIVIISLIFLSPITAQECDIFSDNFDNPDESKWIEKENLWSFKDGSYFATKTEVATISTANTEDLTDFVVETEVLLSDNYFGISIKSPVNDYPMIGLYLAYNEFFILAIPKQVWPLLAFTNPLVYKTNPSQWYKVKLKSEDNLVQAKIWPISEPEPEEWILTLILDPLTTQTFTSGKVALHGSNTKFDNFKITSLACEQPPITPQECTEAIFPKKSFIEIKEDCVLINPSKAGFYRFIYTYNSNNNIEILEPPSANCGSYSCTFPYAFKTSAKKIAVYNNDLKGWVEKNV